MFRNDANGTLHDNIRTLFDVGCKPIAAFCSSSKGQVETHVESLRQSGLWVVLHLDRGLSSLTAVSNLRSIASDSVGLGGRYPLSLTLNESSLTTYSKRCFFFSFFSARFCYCK